MSSFCSAGCRDLSPHGSCTGRAPSACSEEGTASSRHRSCPRAAPCAHTGPEAYRATSSSRRRKSKFSSNGHLGMSLVHSNPLSSQDVRAGKSKPIYSIENTHRVSVLLNLLSEVAGTRWLKLTRDDHRARQSPNISLFQPRMPGLRQV